MIRTSSAIMASIVGFRHRTPSESEGANAWCFYYCRVCSSRCRL